MSKNAKCQAADGPMYCTKPNCPEKLAFQQEIQLHVTAKKNQLANISNGVQDAAKVFLKKNSSLRFENHGDYYTQGKTLTLAEMEDGSKAETNCYIASKTAFEHAKASDFGGSEIELIAIANEDFYHAAFKIKRKDQWYVVDYTARQFDQELPFPYVEAESVWKKQIEETTESGLAYCDPHNYNPDDFWEEEEEEEEDLLDDEEDGWNDEN